MLYVKGLLPDVTEEMITERFEPYGKLDRVRKVKDYAFVHFAEREHCMQVSFTCTVTISLESLPPVPNKLISHEFTNFYEYIIVRN